MTPLHKPSLSRWRQRCALISLLAATTVARAFEEQDEPGWLTLRRSEGYFSLDAEAEQDTSGSSKGGNTTVNRIYLDPVLGIGLDGAVYHPDLLSFSLKPEFQYVWQQVGAVGGSASTTTSWMPGGTGTFTWLQTKPYATIFDLAGSHDIHQYDFFHSAVQDLESWGVSTGYRDGPVPVTLSFQQSQLDSRGFSQNSIFDTSTLNLHAQNDRANNNSTDLSYLYGQFDRSSTVSGQTFHDTSGYHYLTLTDQEHFSKSTLNSTLLFNHLEANSGGSDDLNLALNYTIDHTDNFHSLYDYAFTHYSDDFSDATDNYVRAGVQHQLYESLTSTLDVHGIDSRSSSPGSELDVDTVGTYNTEDYSKRLGSWGHLSIGNAANCELTQQHSFGVQLFISREQHTVTAANSIFRLKAPRDTSIFSVTGDINHSYQPLIEGIDYIVDTSLDPYQITVLFTSLTVQGLETGNGSVKILVSYNVVPNPTGHYSSLADQFQVRLDLFNQLLGFYSRINLIQNYSDVPGTILENVTEFQAGADFSWRGLYLNGNYTDRDSNLYKYHAISFSEGYSFRLPDNAGMGIDLHQQWSTSDPNQKISYEEYLAHFDWQPTPHLNWKIEGGMQRQRGAGANQDLAIARTHLEWAAGKIRVNLGYQYQAQDLSGETQESHFIFLRARRYFW